MAVGAVAGMVGGMMMAMAEMFYGWASPTRHFWDAPMAIWAYVGGIDHFGEPANHVWPILLGIGGHMVNSMIVGVMIVGLLVLFRVRDSLMPMMIAAGLAVGLWALMRYVLLPLNMPEDDLFTKSIVSPQWVWWISHIGLGMGVGIVYAAAQRLGRPRALAPEFGHERLERAA